MAVIKMPGPRRELATVVEKLPGLLTVKDLIRLTGFKKTATYDMVAAATIPFDPIAIADWMREHTVRQAA